MSTSILYKGREAVSALKSSTTMTTTSSLCSLKFLNKCNLGKIHLLPECFYFIFPALQMEQRSFDFGSYEKYEPMRFCFIFLKIIVHCASAPTFFPINSTKKCLSDNGLAPKKKKAQNLQISLISKQSSLNVSAIVCMMQVAT